MYGKTVLAKALGSARLPFDHNEAHSAIYDAQRTAELFCKMINETKTKFNERAQRKETILTPSPLPGGGLGWGGIFTDYPHPNLPPEKGGRNNSSVN